MKKIEKGKNYFFRLRVFGRDLSYSGLVVFLDNGEFGLKTEEDCDLRFSLEDILDVKEIEGKGLDEEKVFVVRKKGPLKEVEVPKGL